MKLIPDIKKDIMITTHCIGEESMSDWDLTLRDSFGYDDNNDKVDFWWVDGENQPEHGVEGQMVPIEEFEKLIKKWKKKGATHLEAQAHVDHHGYDFVFYKLKPSTPKEKEAWKARFKRYREIQKEAEELEDKLDKLRDEARNL